MSWVRLEFVLLARHLPIAVLLCLALCPAATAEQTRIAVASNFSKPMQAIVSVFESTTPHRVQLSTGASGKLFAQIQHGAPYDAFLSADAIKPERLINNNVAVADSRFTYANGQLVLWSRQPIDAKALLDSDTYNNLAIANPRVAPYGKAAIQTLKNLGIRGQARLVIGENISQTFQFVQSGNAELGFVALAQIIQDGNIPKGAWVVPHTMHQPIRQDAVLLNRGKDNVATKALLEFLSSDAAIVILQQFGYTVETE